MNVGIQNDVLGRSVSAADASWNAWCHDYTEGSVLTNEVQTVNGRTSEFVRHVDAFRCAAGYALAVDGVPKGGVGYAYDAAGHVASLSATNASGCVFTVAYSNRNGRCHGYALTTPGGRTLRRVVERDAFRPDLATGCDTFFGDTPIANFRYVHDAAGRPVRRNADAFAYDARGQVTAAAIGGHAFAHGYDEIGNHVLAGVDAVTNAAVHNALNQATVFGGEAMTWNVDGGLASDADWTYSYDAEDRLLSVTSRTRANGAVRVRNGYDYRHRRVLKCVDRYDAAAGAWRLAERHDFTWDDWNIVKYVDESGAVVASYIYDDFGATLAQSGPFAHDFLFDYKAHDRSS